MLSLGLQNRHDLLLVFFRHVSELLRESHSNEVHRLRRTAVALACFFLRLCRADNFLRERLQQPILTFAQAWLQRTDISPSARTCLTPAVTPTGAARSARRERPTNLTWSGWIGFQASPHALSAAASDDRITRRRSRLSNRCDRWT